MSVTAALPSGNHRLASQGGFPQPFQRRSVEQDSAQQRRAQPNSLHGDNVILLPRPVSSDDKSCGRPSDRKGEKQKLDEGMQNQGPAAREEIGNLAKLLGLKAEISFATGSPNSGLIDVRGIEEATAAVLRDPSVLQYGSPDGYAPLIDQLVIYMKAMGMAVDPKEMLVTTGSQQGIDVLAKLMIKPGDKVIVEGPTYLAALDVFKQYGAEIVSAPIDEDGVRIDKLEELIKLHEPKFVYLIPNFSNPSGATLSLERRLEVLKLTVKNNVMILEDDPYANLSFDRAPPPSLLALSSQVPGSRSRLAYLGSLSKVLSPGLRVGWMVAPPKLLEKAKSAKALGDTCTSPLNQAIAAKYLEMGRMPANLQRIRDGYRERLRLMSEELQNVLGDRVTFKRPKGGMFLWLELTGRGGATKDAELLVRRALERGVSAVPGPWFFPGEGGESALRLCFASAGPEQIKKGCERLLEALHDGEPNRDAKASPDVAGRQLSRAGAPLRARL